MSREQRIGLSEALRAAPPALEAPTIEREREDFARLMAGLLVPPGTRSTETALGGRPALLVEPAERPRPGTMLYFHGGSFALGSPRTAMPITANLVLRAGVRAISLDYRLAPEHPFPAAIDDGVAAYRALLDQGDDPASIALVGDSAGGYLVVTVALAARDAGLPIPAGLVAFSPVLDLTRSGASMRTKAPMDPFLTPEGLARSGERYLGGADPRQPLLAPAVLADLTGLPPILLQTGSDEILLDDAVRLAARARDAEVDVVLDVTARAPHVFQGFAGTLEEADEALDRAALFLQQRLRVAVLSPAARGSAGS